MIRTPITEEEYEAKFTLAEGFGNSKPIRVNSKIFDFYIEIQPEQREFIFTDCEFLEPILFCKGVQLVQVVQENNEEPDLFNEAETNIFSENVTFKECDFIALIQFDDITFNKKFKMLKCNINNASFHNTTFNGLADFWLSTFNEDIIFYKTDFNKTTVFSMATFIGNVLFTYSLFATKAIFARTKFNKGFDLSQAIISGKLQPFDLQFDFKEFRTEYVGKDDETFQNYIDSDAIIPLVNKVHTFQILKKAFQDIGNYSDSILMQREEKRALNALIKEKLKDNNLDVNKGDILILRLNRWSNHYQSDFRNGIWFTLAMIVLFGVPTLISTSAYLDNVCFTACEFSGKRTVNGIKFFLNFLNPARNFSYLEKLDPYGIAYILDFFGRIAVGYGIYQTVQAFRKYK